MFNPQEDQQMEDMEIIQIDFNITTQFQVIIKPSPSNIKKLYLNSLLVLGIDYKDHDIRFVEDDWESPTSCPQAWMGSWCDGMEITQFTYFQQMAGFECKPFRMK